MTFHVLYLIKFNINVKSYINVNKDLLNYNYKIIKSELFIIATIYIIYV